MPFHSVNPPQKIVTVQAPTSSGTVESTPLPVSEAIAVANQPVKVLTTAAAPTVGNLPANARPGEMYQFQSNPGTIYVYGSDNIWRAIVLVSVA